ncbi:hypothetical protein BKA65DRAFT_554662 [Rhexocercosporidium sp. MPI-PUGE-AT-0058]|nr:hypothetical protein BKA65DRAFT_554662 [Rhexocercosporidium sp. MPI-PUGE-AT-0058]
MVFETKLINTMADSQGNHAAPGSGAPGPNSNASPAQRRLVAIPIQRLMMIPTARTSTRPPPSYTHPTSSRALNLSATFGRINVIGDNLDDPVIFVGFPKLPLELRLKIWRNSFPGQGRHVGFTVGFSQTQPKDRQIGSPQKPPASFEVCSESRAETLKHYIMIAVEPVSSGLVLKSDVKQIVYPFLFNPKFDTLYTESGFFYHRPLRNELLNFIGKVNEFNPTVLSNIVTLEIREMDHKLLETYGRKSINLNKFNKPLLMFPSLKIIRYTFNISEWTLNSWNTGLGDMYASSLKMNRGLFEEKIDGWLVNKAKKFTSGKAPVVRFRWELPVSEQPLPSWTLVQEDMRRR